MTLTNSDRENAVHPRDSLDSDTTHTRHVRHKHATTMNTVAWFIPNSGREVIAVHLELLSREHFRACFNFRLVNLVNGSSTAVSSSAGQLFDTVSKGIRFGRGHIMLGKELEGSEFLRDDRLVIECDVTVFMEPQVVAKISTASSMGGHDEVLPPDVAEDLANLLGADEGADVTFKVQDEVFNAHAIVLAMRSPVFKTEFFGHMKESSRVHQQDRTVIVEDMQPAVFKALLRFIYTDCLVFTDVSGHDEDRTELTKNLLVAADRYDIQGLRFLCQKDLCESLAVDTVAATLAFADQHNCVKLKDACIEFITSLPSIDDVVASEGSKILKESYPACLVDIFESVTRELYASRNQIEHDI
ncbi:hypothetical protein HU200_061143 [Digitaria exilis]|uniref:BTB domain-containing protein n=1 Tax=Digitaria exilis TaxID=1010633 RepID=A0A835DWT5_9POAL|nr:hypothetical protein HU200_061143 [Digitaria exilis]